MAFRIGEFARLTGVSAKTLRYYDEIGLLRPEFTDSRTRYRLYSPRQCQTMAAVLAFKELGLSLQEIRLVLQDRRAQGRRKLLEQARRRTEQALSENTRCLAWIDAELEDPGCDPQVPVVLRHRSPLRIASLATRLVAYADMRDFERELSARVPAAVRGAMRGALWHRCADSGAIEGEPFLEVRTAFKADASIRLNELPAMTAACAYSADSEEAAEAAFAAIKRWIRVHGYTLQGPKCEIYRPGLVEIQFPVVPDLEVRGSRQTSNSLE